LIGLTARAARQFHELRRHYEDRERPEAISGLIATMEEVSRKIETSPGAGVIAPAPIPS
jgi:hypothetical protein